MRKKLVLPALVMASAILVPKAAFAADIFTYVPDVVKGGPSADNLITNIINLLLYVAGIASIIVIIVGGFMFVVSAGNPERTKVAKDAILYAVIGLVISLSAFAIVNFVLGGL